MMTMIPPPNRLGQPVNLLDNSDFAIAQAGYGGMHGATRYVADRWANTYGFGTFKAANPGVTMTYATNHAYANQRISNSTRLVGKVLTFAVMTDEFGLLLCSGQYTATNAVDARYYNDRCEVVIADGSARIVVVEGALTVRWATCYEGEYTPDTLPAYYPRPFAAELLQCQRYYENSWYPQTKSAGNEMFVIPWRDIEADGRIEFKAPKCIVPTITFFPENGKNTWEIYHDTYHAIRNVSVVARGGVNAIVFRLTKESDTDASLWVPGKVMQARGHWEACADL